MFTRGRVAVIVLALVAAAALAIVGRDALQRREECGLVETYVSKYGMTRTVGNGPADVLAVGDSYLTGDALPERDDRWVVEFADATGSTVRANGLGYTGYVNEGVCGDAALPARTSDLDPGDLTVLAAGLNDVDSDRDELEAAASEVLDDLSGAPVLMVGPVDVPGREGEAEVDATLAQVADEAGATYLSMLELDPALGADGVHMSAEGHATYAAAVAEAARPLLASVR